MESHKNLFITLAILLVIVVGVGVAVAMRDGGDDTVQEKEVYVETPSTVGVIGPSLAQYFIEQMQNEVVENLGQPIEGFEPQMYMSVFSQLTIDDFHRVDAEQGEYRVVDGELTFKLYDDIEVEHSAARAIIENGMFHLLSNTSSRVGVGISDEESIDRLLNVLR